MFSRDKSPPFYIFIGGVPPPPPGPPPLGDAAGVFSGAQPPVGAGTPPRCALPCLGPQMAFPPRPEPGFFSPQNFPPTFRADTTPPPFSGAPISQTMGIPPRFFAPNPGESSLSREWGPIKNAPKGPGAQFRKSPVVTPLVDNSRKPCLLAPGPKMPITLRTCRYQLSPSRFPIPPHSSGTPVLKLGTRPLAVPPLGAQVHHPEVSLRARSSAQSRVKVERPAGQFGLSSVPFSLRHIGRYPPGH